MYDSEYFRTLEVLIAQNSATHPGPLLDAGAKWQSAHETIRKMTKNVGVALRFARLRATYLS